MQFLSRQHVKIQFLIPTAAGGCGQIQSKVQKPGDKFYFNTEDPVKAEDIQIPRRGGDNETKITTLPETGFFAITCMGKNRISVNGQRVEQGQTCLLEPGAAVRLGGFALYFLTPLDDSRKTTMEVRDDVPPTKKRRISLGGGKGGASVSTAIKPVVAGSGAGAGIEEQAQARRQPKHSQAGSKKTLQTELDALPTKELLKQMNQGIEDNIWDRRHQLIGSTLSYRAVLSATRSSELQKLAAEHKGELSRGEIMDWIAESDRYKAWVEHMLSKMEAKSYQASITKALLKAGFERTSTHGRYIKWIVPSDLFSPPAGGTDEGEGEGEGDDDEEEEEEDDDGGDSDQSGDDQEDVDDATGEVKSVGSDQSDEEEEEEADDDDDDDNNNTRDEPDEPDGANHDTTATSAEEVTGVASTDEA